MGPRYRRFRLSALFMFSAMLILPSVGAFAQSPRSPIRIGPKLPAGFRLLKVKPPVAGKMLSSRFLKRVKRKPVVFKPLTVQGVNARLKKSGSRGKRKPYKLTSTITLPGKGLLGATQGGLKSLSLQNALQKYNKILKLANAAGFDLSVQQNVVGASIQMPTRLMRSQRGKLRSNFKRVTPLRTSRKFSHSKLRLKRPASLRRLPKLKSFEHGAPKSKMRARGKIKDKIKKYAKYSPKPFTKTWGPYGDTGLAAVGIEAKLTPYADLDKVELKADGYARVWLFGNKKTAFSAHAHFVGNIQKKKTNGGITLKILGKEKVLLTWPKSGSRGKAGALFSHSDSKDFSDEWSYKQKFVIVFIPASVRVGAEFTAGVRWGIDVGATYVSAEVTPFIDSTAFAQFSAIDIEIASAGVEGRVTLLDAGLKIKGEVGLAKDGSGSDAALYVYSIFTGDLILSALDGSLSVFFTIWVPKDGWKVWDWVKKKYSETIFSWNGFSDSFRLFTIETDKWYLAGKPDAVGPVSEGTPDVKEAGPVRPGGKRVAGQWGSWAKKFSTCPKGTYAYAFRQKIEPKQGRGDDTALNAVQIKCRDAKGKRRRTLKSSEGRWGKWSKWASCSKGRFLSSFKMRVEPKQGRGDDSAANDVQFKCSNGKTLIANRRGGWGKWQNGQNCGSKGYISGFKTRIEGKQGKGDDTAMNGLEIQCSPRPKARPKKYVCKEGRKVGKRACHIQTILGLKKVLGNKCGRNSGKCPCFLKAGQRKGTGVLYCTESRSDGKKNTCRSKASRFVENMNIGPVSVRLCKFTAFRGPRGKGLKDISKCRAKPYMKKFMGFPTGKPTWGFRQDTCPYYIHSKSDKIMRIAE